MRGCEHQTKQKHWAEEPSVGPAQDPQRPSKAPLGPGSGGAKTVGSGLLGPGQGHAESESLAQVRTTWPQPRHSGPGLGGMTCHISALSCRPSTAVLTPPLITAACNGLLGQDGRASLDGEAVDTRSYSLPIWTKVLVQIAPGGLGTVNSHGSGCLRGSRRIPDGHDQAATELTTPVRRKSNCLFACHDLGRGNLEKDNNPCEKVQQENPSRVASSGLTCRGYRAHTMTTVGTPVSGTTCTMAWDDLFKYILCMPVS